MIAASMPPETLLLLKRRISFTLMKNYYLITTMMHMTSGLRLSTARRKLSHFLKETGVRRQETVGMSCRMVIYRLLTPRLLTPQP